LGEQWVKECSDYLNQIREAQTAEAPDRLELVRLMHLALLALNHSVWGWLQYVNNPDIIGKFNRDELNEIGNFLNKFAEEFLEYDIKVTKAGMEKGLSEIKQHQHLQQSFYV
jgi:hypothetical protein